jgi:hypothetical protein
MREEYLLQRGQEAVGSLTFRSGLGTMATGRYDARSWTFKRLGFLRTRVTVRVVDTETDIATFHPTTWSGGGTLELPGGRQFKVEIDFWQTRFAILDHTNRALVRFRPRGVFHLGADMDVLARSARVVELPWLMLFGWYLAVLIKRDAGAAAVS